MVALSTPVITVVMDDDREMTVQCVNADLLAWDRTRVAKRWPKSEDAPFPWLTFLAWHALKRTGQIDGMALPDFETACLQVTAREQPVDPTQPAVAEG